MASFGNVIQPDIEEISVKDHSVKGRWKKEVFNNDNPVILELGCGKGEYTIGLANRFPEHNFIGIDIKGARIWRGAKTAIEQELKNVAFLRTRIEFINSFFSRDEVDEIWITFPDPHPGGRNSNKRLTSPRFLKAYSLFLKNNGTVHLKTDNKELFDYTKKVVKVSKLDCISETSDLYSEDNGDDILSIRTHYEEIFLKDGLTIYYLAFKLEKEKIISDTCQNQKS